MKEKQKICQLCKKEINTKKEAWCEVVDYTAEVKVGVGYYHRWCLNDIIKGKGEVIQKRFEEKLKNLTKGIFGNILARKIEE